jgi:hypothetical protein
MDKHPYFSALHRPYPREVAGYLFSYRYDPENKQFQCTWQEDSNIKAPSRIYIPNGIKLKQEQISLSPDNSAFRIIPVQQNSTNIILEVKPSGRNIQRELTVILNKM